MTFTFLACSITGAKPTLQTLTSSASQLRANTIGQDYFSCCGGGETEARSKERADLSPLRGAPFALTSRRHPAPILTSIDFRRSHLWSKACGWWDAVGWILMPGPSSEVPLRVWEAAAVPPAGEWDTHFRGCDVLAHPGLFLWSHAHSATSTVSLPCCNKQKAPTMGQCPMPRGSGYAGARLPA